MFKYPYETTPISNYVLKDIVAALQRAMVDKELRRAQTLSKATVDGMYEVPSYVKSVPPFSHPIVFDHFGKMVTVVDTRPFVRDSRDGGMRVANETEYRFMILRGVLTKLWAEGTPNDFVTMGDIAARVYTRFLSEGVVRRLNLTPGEHQKIAVISAYFYFSLFMPADVEVGHALPEEKRVKLATRIARVTNVPADFCLKTLDDVPHFNDVDGYCRALYHVTGSPRLEKFSVGMLYAIVSGGWFGASAREIVAVSIEYPPTFFAMLYMALTDRTYHKAYFTELVIASNKNNLGKEFQLSMNSYLEGALNV